MTNNNIENNYIYKIAEVLRVVDGDTVDVMIDLGFEVYRKERLRLLGIDAPETRTRDLVEKAKGFETKDWLSLQLVDANEIFVQSTTSGSTGKYGRYLAVLWADGVNLNEEMLEKGLAEEYK